MEHKTDDRKSMRHRVAGRVVWRAALAGAALLLPPAMARAQRIGIWSIPGGNPQHDNWQPVEMKLSSATVPSGFKFLWKVKLGQDTSNPRSFTEPLLQPGLITGHGFKDMVLWADSETVYSVDSELGTLIWKRDFNLPQQEKGPCAGANLQILIDPPRVIHFGAPRAPGAPPVRFVHPRPIPPGERRVGDASSGGFGIRGLFVLTSDGMLHEQIMATGKDYAPPVNFLPTPAGAYSALNKSGSTIYVAAGDGCTGVPNAVWSIDLSTSADRVGSYRTASVPVWNPAGPAAGMNGEIYVQTFEGRKASTDSHPNSIVGLEANDLKVTDWFTPARTGKGAAHGAGPIAFSYKGQELIAALDAEGRIVVLQSGSLGGADHHTPLVETDPLIGKVRGRAEKDAWEGLASWTDRGGVPWIFVSISGEAARGLKFAASNGPAPHGSVLAFKLQEQDGKLALVPGWISRDLVHPAPPAVANGVVLALSGGDGSRRAMLYALDGASGKALYSSGDSIDGSTGGNGMSVGGGHVFFTTEDNTLYSFGIPLEH